MKLALNCPLNDKAFTNQHRGKVLGVMFDASDLTWRLSNKKLWKAKVVVKKALGSVTCTLREWQQLMGRLNDISQMCSFMKAFKHPINRCVEGIDSDAPQDTTVHISHQAKCDLQVWANFLMSPFKWLPISSHLCEPSRWTREFVSDAAGLAAQASWQTRPGCGNVRSVFS